MDILKISERFDKILDKSIKAFSGYGGAEISKDITASDKIKKLGNEAAPVAGAAAGANYGAVAGINTQDTYAGAAAGTPGVGGVGQEEKAIAAIMAKKGATDMKPEEIAKELNAMGIQATAQGKELRFPNGKVIRDTDGDGNIGMKDKEFAAAIQQLAATDPNAQAILAKFQQKNPEKAAKLGIGGAAPVGAANTANAANGLGNYNGVLNQLNQGFGQGGPQVKGMLDDVQAKFDEKGYTDNTAQGLFQQKKLEPVAMELGIDVPAELAQAQNQKAMCPCAMGTAMNMFQMALMPYVNQLQ